MRTVQRARSSRAVSSHGLPVRRPRRATPGAWRSRVRHRPDPGGGAGGSPRPGPEPLVLLVDDEASIRTICRVNLEGEGLRVVEAVSGAEALVQVRRHRPALVLLDVMMPGVDGWRVAEALARDPETRAVPVVFLSARAAAEDRLRAQELGAVGYVVKPFDPLSLAGTVREVLDRIGRGERERLNRELAER
ncbi:MAG TPA: response regulator [Gaiellaceae bacterium]|nr:response regulator [Gaiellaceae bacterium]